MSTQAAWRPDRKEIESLFREAMRLAADGEKLAFGERTRLREAVSKEFTDRILSLPNPRNSLEGA